MLQRQKGSMELAQKGLAILKDVARHPDAQAYQVFDAAKAGIVLLHLSICNGGKHGIRDYRQGLGPPSRNLSVRCGTQTRH